MSRVGHAVRPRRGTPPLVLASMGVVFGDICTSPLYALRESFAGHHPMSISVAHVYGILSLITWSILIIVTAKYVLLTMRADNDGEGGSLALLSLITRMTGRPDKGPGDDPADRQDAQDTTVNALPDRRRRRHTSTYILLGVCATSLFFGDSIITPAISVLSAVEGLQVVNPAFEAFVLPIAAAILLGLFAMQRFGTAVMGKLFGPVILVWCLVLAALGVRGIAMDPSVLQAFSPQHAVVFMFTEPLKAFLALGAVVLVVTGAEAVYADMGQFGKKPIRIAWLCIVLPSLLVNYAGQAALVINDPSTIESPFFMLAPGWARLPLVLLAACATIIASQAVISGAFSIAAQAIQLGFLPRLRVVHTSEDERGQVYLPSVNLLLMVLVLLLLVAFRSSSNLSAAYGIAVTGTMLIDTILLSIVMFGLWRWNRLIVIVIIGTFIVLEGAYFASNLLKLLDGGWVPVLIGAIAFTMITSWSRGRELLRDQLEAARITFGELFSGGAGSIHRVPGTAVFMTRMNSSVPTALLHNLKHNKVLHERTLVVEVITRNIPFVNETDRVKLHDLGHGIIELEVSFGFADIVDLPRALRNSGCVKYFDALDTSWFMGRQTVRPARVPLLRPWRRRLFAWMLRNGAPASEYYRLPSNRVVELGSEVRL